MRPDETNIDLAEKGQSNFADFESNSLVYVRAVAVEDVKDDLAEQDSSLAEEIPAGTILYALHAPNGDRIALMGNRELAFAAARQNEFRPVSVH